MDTNGASGTGDIEGKTVRARGEEAGRRPSFNKHEWWNALSERVF